MERMVFVFFLLLTVMSRSSACNIDIKINLDSSLAHANKVVPDEMIYSEIWYKSLNNFANKSGLIPDIAIAYAQAGCWADAQKTALSLIKTGSEYDHSRYSYAISNMAILKAYEGDMTSAQSLLNDIGKSRRNSNRVYGALRISEILTRNGNFPNAMIFLTENMDIDDGAAPNLIHELLLGGDFDQAKTQADNSQDMQVISPYLKYLIEHDKKTEAYELLARFAEETSDRELSLWEYRELAICYSMLDDLGTAITFSKKVEKEDEIALLSNLLPYLQHASNKEKLSKLIFDKFQNLTSEEKLKNINSIAFNYAASEYQEEFIKVLNSITDNPKKEYRIQLAVNTFIQVSLQRNNISLAEKAAKRLFSYINPQDGRGFYLLQAETALLKGEFEKAYDFGLKTENSFLQMQLMVLLASKSPDLNTIKQWNSSMPRDKDGKKIVDPDTSQVISSRLAFLNSPFDPKGLFSTEDNYVIAKSWLGYAQGKMKINPGIEYLFGAESPTSESLIYQLFKR